MPPPALRRTPSCADAREPTRPATNTAAHSFIVHEESRCVLSERVSMIKNERKWMLGSVYTLVAVRSAAMPLAVGVWLPCARKRGSGSSGRRAEAAVFARHHHHHQREPSLRSVIREI